MQRKRYPLLWILILPFLFLTSCKTKDKQQEVDAMKMDLSTENLDRQLFRCKSVGEVSAFLDKNPYLTNLYFSDAPLNTEQRAAQLYNILQNPDFRSFKEQLDSLIGNRDSLIVKPLARAFKNIRYYYPDFQPPAIKFIVTGFSGNDLYVSDSLIVIGLDYFGGPAARFRPNVYDYQLTRYQKDQIVPSIIFFLAAKYNRTNPADKTLLADMIGYGKDYAFAKEMLPDMPQSLITGFSDNNLRRAYNSQADIWAFFIAGKLLYEKSDLIKQKYIGERPFTTEIGNKVPGGIARWVGWRIVEVFRKQHPDITLQELMQMDNSVKLLEESGYNGQKDEAE